METNIATQLREQLKNADAEVDRLTIVNGQLVEALQVAIEVADLHPQHAKYAARWRELLRKLGEEVPPLEDE